MNKLLTSGWRRAIEPTSIDKAPPDYIFGIDMASGQDYSVTRDGEILRPSPLMRMMGYTAHPATCTHYRKRLMLGSTQWHCADCGVSIR